MLLVILAVGIAELTARQFPHAYKIMSVAGYSVLGLMLVVWFVAVVRRRGSPGVDHREPVSDRRWIRPVAISAVYGILGLSFLQGGVVFGAKWLDTRDLATGGLALALLLLAVPCFLLLFRLPQLIALRLLRRTRPVSDRHPR